MTKNIMRIILISTLLAACGKQTGFKSPEAENLSRGLVFTNHGYKGPSIDVTWGGLYKATDADSEKRRCVKWDLELYAHYPADITSHLDVEIVDTAYEPSPKKATEQDSIGIADSQQLNDGKMIVAHTRTYGGFDGVRLKLPPDGAALILHAIATECGSGAVIFDKVDSINKSDGSNPFQNLGYDKLKIKVDKNKISANQAS